MYSLEALLSEQVATEIIAPCKVTVIGSKLDEPYRSAFFNLVDKTFPQGGLQDNLASKRLAQAGIRISPTTLNRHRRGLCFCAKG